MGKGDPYHWPDLLDAVTRGEWVDWWPYGGGVESLGLGWGLTSWEPGVARGEQYVDSSRHHSMGAVFGGVLSAMADLATTWGMFTVLDDDEAFITSDLRVSYFRPMVEGTISWESQVVHRGRRNCYVEAKFTDERDKLIYQGSATEIVVPLPAEFIQIKE